MSNTYTPAVKLAMPAIGDTGWSVPVNGNCSTLDALNPVGDLAVTTHEQPSSSLHIDIAPGSFINQAGTVATFAGASNQSVAASNTSYVYLTNAGALVINTTGFPAAPGLYIPLATVVTGTSSVTGISDQRVAFPVVGSGYLPTGGGTMTDGANIALGTSTGTQIATSSSQKLGFFGKTPVVQPTLGAATAGSSYGSNEQTMLQAVYNAVRNLGLGS